MPSALLRRPNRVLRTSRGLVAAACVLALQAAAQTPPPAALPADAACRDQASLAAQGVAYRCLRLRDGQWLWVGRAGPVGQPMVLVVHGLGQNAHADWTRTVPRLAERWNVVTVDLPGFGASPARADAAQTFERLSALLAEVIERLSPSGRAHVVGHSLGAALSLHLADQHPERVDRLVLVSAAGILYKPVYLQALAAVRPPRVGFAPADGVLGFLADRVNGLSSALLLGHDQRADLGPWLQRNPLVRQALVGNHPQTGAALALAEHDFSAALRRVKAPTTLIWGRNDGIAPLRTGQALAGRLPQARLQVIEDAGHTPMLEQPAVFNRLLVEALARDGEPEPLPVAADAPSQGHLSCREAHGRTYSGRIESLVLERCTGVRIENAQIGRLEAFASTLQLLRTRVQSDDVALFARDSEVTATASQIVGHVAIEADNSYFDLAGVQLRAGSAGLRQRGTASRLFLSVSDWQAPDWQGDAHGVWPPARR